LNKLNKNNPSGNIQPGHPLALAITAITLAYLGFAVSCSTLTSRDSARSKRAGQTDSLIQIDLAQVHQAITGFGVACGWTSPTMDDSMADACFTVDKGIGLTLLRMTITPNGTSLEMETAKQAIKRGASVWAAPWSPPAEWKDNHDVNNGGHLLPGHRQDWADRLASFAMNAVAEGVPLIGISAQNEPGYVPDPPNSWETCEYTPEALTEFIRDYLGPTLVKQDLNLSIIAPETGGWDTFDKYADVLISDPKAMAFKVIIATHSYSGTAHLLESVQGSGHQVWQTEYSDQSGHMWKAPVDNGMNSALLIAWQIHADLVDGNVSAWHHWTINPTNSTTNDGLTDGRDFTRRAWVLGNWSRFVRPGFVRIDATPSPRKGVLVSAFVNPKTNCMVIVLVNNRNRDLSQCMSVSNGTSPSSFTVWTTSDEFALKQTGSLSASRDGTFTATLPARSVTTLVSELP
jgi:glucuronoarabinoxylan endo-1,4-beta-xylanase